MALSVQSYNPGTISGVTTANPGKITGVSTTPTGSIGYVGPNYGMQQSPFVTQPLINLGGGKWTTSPQPAPTPLKMTSAQSLGGSSATPPQVYAPKIDLKSIQTQAKQLAENSVNPKYIEMMQKLLERKAVEQARAKEDFNLNQQALEDSLAKTLAQNELTRTRTGEDVSNNLSNINTAEDRLQYDAGVVTDKQRMDQAQQVAASGLGTSGLARQQVNDVVDNRNLVESRQGEDFVQKRASQALLKARTFEDLGRADIYAGEAKKKASERSQIDLNRMMQDLDYQEQQNRDTLEQKRIAEVLQNSNSQAKVLVNNFIAAIADPAQRQAAYQAYGGLY